MSTTIPKHPPQILGSVCTGAEGPNRTYTIPYPTLVVNSLEIYINGQFIHAISSYSIVGQQITFLIDIYDSMIIDLYFDIETSTSTSNSVTYSSPLGFFKYLNMVKEIPAANSQGGSEILETVGVGDNATTLFFLDNMGIIEDTYTLYYGTSVTSNTALTDSTHYTLDLDTSKITLTSTGKTLIGVNTIYAAYKYNDSGIPNSEVLRLLAFAENYIERNTEQKFANFTDDNPGYRKVVDELFEGRSDSRWKTFDTFYNPLVEFDTELTSNYTTGGVIIAVTSTVGLPTTGTINIGGNKVTYTNKSSTTLTVPITTPSITSGSKVYAHVVEVSKESEGSEPSYIVLDPLTDYKIDYLQGRIELLGTSYFGQFRNTDRFYPLNYIIRLCYFNAHHDFNELPHVPADIEQCTYMIASNRVMKSVVARAHISGMNNFNPALVAVDRTDIDEIIEEYRILNVGTSPFNKSHIS